MTKLPHAILASSLVLALAIIFAVVNPAESQRSGGGYMVAGAGTSQFVWRVNTLTGSVSYCVRKDNSTDEKFIARRPPYCSASTPAR